MFDISAFSKMASSMPGKYEPTIRGNYYEYATTARAETTHRALDCDYYPYCFVRNGIHLAWLSFMKRWLNTESNLALGLSRPRAATSKVSEITRVENAGCAISVS